MQYRLSQQVALVRGKHGAGLYDLHRSRIQTISARTADAIEGGSTAEESQQEVLRQLHCRGFLRQDDAAHRGDSFSADASSPYFPLLRTLSFDMRGPEPLSRFPQILRIVREGLEFGLASVVFLVEHRSRPTLDVVVSALRNVHQTLMIETLFYGASDVRPAPAPKDAYFSEVIPGDAAIGLHRRPDGPGFVRGARPSRADMEPGLLITNYAYFHLLRRFGESYGCLHFDPRLAVFPDLSESDHRIATYGDEVSDVAGLLAHPKLRHYWNFGKDRREKCRDCVFRYACPNPLSSRSLTADLASAPMNCRLDLETGKWGAP